MNRTSFLKILSILFTIIIISPLASFAKKELIPNGYYYISPAIDKNYRIDNGGGVLKDKQNVHIWSAFLHTNQLWEIENVSNGGIIIRSGGNPKYVLSPIKNSNNDQMNVTISLYIGSPNQVWYPKKEGEGLIRLENKIEKNLVLALPNGAIKNTTNVQLNKKGATNIQKWLFEPLSESDVAKMMEIKNGIKDGYYYISPAANTKVRIDNDSGRETDNNLIHIWENIVTPNETWRLENVQGGVVFRSGNNEDYVISCYDNKLSDNNKIVLFQYNNKDSQIWVPEKIDELTYRFHNKANPEFVISAGNKKPENYTNITLNKNREIVNQEWKIYALSQNDIKTIKEIRSKIPDGWYFIYPKNYKNFRIDRTGGPFPGMGGAVTLKEKNKTPEQLWYVANLPEGGIRIISKVNPSWVLDNANAIVQNQNNIGLFWIHENPAQMWNPYKTQKNTYMLLYLSNPDFVLAAGNGEISDGKNIELWNGNEVENKYWVFEPCSSEEYKELNKMDSTIPDGYYYIHPSDNRGVRLDNGYIYVANQNNIIVYANNLHPNQVWKIENRPDGKIVFRTMTDEFFVLDDSGGKISNGNNIWIYEHNDTPAQHWIPEKGPYGYKFKSALDPNYLLAVEGESINNSSNVVIFADNTAKFSNWVLSPVPENEMTELKKIKKDIDSRREIMNIIPLSLFSERFDPQDDLYGPGFTMRNHNDIIRDLKTKGFKATTRSYKYNVEYCGGITERGTAVETTLTKNFIGGKVTIVLNPPTDDIFLSGYIKFSSPEQLDSFMYTAIALGYKTDIEKSNAYNTQYYKNPSDCYWEGLDFHVKDNTIYFQSLWEC